jgi:hypothetical protein
MMLCQKTNVEKYRPILEAVMDTARFEPGFGYRDNSVAPEGTEGIGCGQPL